MNIPLWWLVVLIRHLRAVIPHLTYFSQVLDPLVEVYCPLCRIKGKLL
ncbi:hypothetical protein J2Z37_003452 [Ammoniphilus resinae]|uniref:Uncharacterized protein n=1 Tax=Ammoniphilus resinae TaxID=861532 RepID=A0ABS4GT31_9BACL|nr:hypothetical protein [Ammoniphilus resinae]